jgi:hypothetical protein
MPRIEGINPNLIEFEIPIRLTIKRQPIRFPKKEIKNILKMAFLVV